MFELTNWDGAWVIGVCFFEDVIGLFHGDFGVCQFQEGVEVVEGDLVNLAGEAHLVEDFLEVEVVAAYVEPEFVEDHFEFVLELAGVGHWNEVALENRVCEDLVPGNAVFFVDF